LNFATKNILKDHRLRFLIVGGVNTLAGLLISAGIFFSLRDYIHTLILASIANFLAISVAFVNQKIFVFRTSGFSFLEYFRGMLGNSATALFSIILFWLLIDYYELSFWSTQLIIIPMVTIVSYATNRYFIFRDQNF